MNIDCSHWASVPNPKLSYVSSFYRRRSALLFDKCDIIMVMYQISIALFTL